MEQNQSHVQILISRLELLKKYILKATHQKWVFLGESACVELRGCSQTHNTKRHAVLSHRVYAINRSIPDGYCLFGTMRQRSHARGTGVADQLEAGTGGKIWGHGGKGKVIQCSGDLKTSGNSLRENNLLV